jgi:hypothetical protein
MRDLFLVHNGAQIRFSRYDVVYVDESAEAISTLDVVWRR